MLFIDHVYQVKSTTDIYYYYYYYSTTVIYKVYLDCATSDECNLLKTGRRFVLEAI